MYKKRNKKTGRFTSGWGVTREHAPDVARQYYQDHKKSLDKYIPSVPGKTKEDIFVDIFKYGISNDNHSFVDILSRSNSKKAWKDKIDKAVAYLKGHNLSAWEAKKFATGGEAYGFKDKRKLTMKRFDLNQQEQQYYYDNGLSQKDPNFFSVEGYFEIANSDVVIARVYRPNEFAEGSPILSWEFFRRSEIGLL